MKPLTALIEIPTGSRLKWESDPESHRMAVDRVLPPGKEYPANYGSLIDTLAEDGDPLDVIVLTPSPLATGHKLEIEPIAMLEMRDRDERDAKIIGVPAGTSEAGHFTLTDERRAEIETFFRTYKGRAVHVQRWTGPEAAQQEIADAQRNFATHSAHHRVP